jgi:hypothetical protein
MTAWNVWRHWAESDFPELLATFASESEAIAYAAEWRRVEDEAGPHPWRNDTLEVEAAPDASAAAVRLAERRVEVQSRARGDGRI